MRAFTRLAILIVLAGCSEDPASTGDAGGERADAAAIDAGAPTDGGDTPEADAGHDAGAEPDAGPPGPPTSAGCVDGAGLPEGERTFTLEDRARRYVLRLPDGYTRDRAWPLVLALHGNGGSASYWDGTSGGRNIREVLRDDAILIVAEAIDGNWRDYDMPADTWPARIESELLYFDTVLSEARDALCIREDAIFAMGFSGGGSFSGVLACRRTDIRAIAVGGSVIYFDEAECVGEAAAWITIGTMELNAGRTQFRDFFRDRAGCTETSMSTDPAPCIAYDGCDEATPVHYCQHPAGHVWPDFGSTAMWAFFEQLIEP
jgi:polyhydroxybutyrate depolymerase